MLSISRGDKISYIQEINLWLIFRAAKLQFEFYFK